MAQKEEELKLEEQEQEQETPTTSEEQTTPTTAGEAPVTTGEESSSTSQEESAVKTRTPITATQIEAPQLKNNYEKYWQEYKNVNPFDEEEYNKRKRRARSAMLLEALNKGVASISNIVSASKGRGKAPGTKVPPIYEGLKSKAYYDAIEKERQTNYEAWRKGAENAAKLGAKYDKDNAEMQFKVDDANVKNKLAADKAEADQQNKDAESGAKVKKTEAEKKHIEGKTENEKKESESKVGLNKAKAEAERAKGKAAIVKAYQTGNGTPKDKNDFTLEINGVTTYYKNATERNKAAYRYCQEHGLSTDVTISEGMFGEKKTRKMTAEEVCGMVEAESNSYDNNEPSFLSGKEK